MITQEKFDKVIKLFNNLEQFRGELYPMALKLLNNGFESEAYILILATWNFANFRYVMNDFDLENFKNLMNDLEPYFENLEKKTFEQIEFSDFKEEIKKIYSPLSEIEGIKYTGASKIIHLKNPKLFIMWDDYIRKDYGIQTKDYKGYIQFLEKMQLEFKNILTGDKNKTKTIDEYNYISITRLEIIKNKIKNIEKKRKKGKKISEEKLFKLNEEKKLIENALK